MKEQESVSISRLVFPIATIGAIVGLAFWSGVEYSRLNFVYETQQKVLSTLERMNGIIQQMQIQNAANAVQLGNNALKLDELVKRERSDGRPKSVQ